MCCGTAKGLRSDAVANELVRRGVAALALAAGDLPGLHKRQQSPPDLSQAEAEERTDRTWRRCGE